MADFNPRSHGGSDGYSAGRLLLIQRISIHAPTGGATESAFGKVRHPREFQSTLPRGERPKSGLRTEIRVGYFNPRSHGGSDPLANFFQTPLHDFNPRSHGGSDKCIPVFMTQVSIFQSTLPRGERLTAFRHKFIWVWISIHAPTGGATIYGRLHHVSTGDFNPRSHGGSDADIFIKSAGLSPFQSTLPRGERQFTGWQMNGRFIISIHAPTGGATVLAEYKGNGSGISIHAPTGGAT